MFLQRFPLTLHLSNFVRSYVQGSVADYLDLLPGDVLVLLVIMVFVLWATVRQIFLLYSLPQTRVGLRAERMKLQEVVTKTNYSWGC